MFEEPDNLQVSPLLDCSEEEKASSFFPTSPINHIESPKLHKKRTKTLMGSSPDRGRKKEGKGREGRVGRQGGAMQNFGHWSVQQNKRYHWFLEMHSQHFLHKHMRRMDKIFKSMAIFVGSREAEQCRSHHQKMEKKFNHAICPILLHLRHHHYHSTLQFPVRQDILVTGHHLGGELLSQEFLLQHMHQDRQDEEHLVKKEEVQRIIEQCKEQVDVERLLQLDENQLLQSYPLNFSKNLVDTLLEVDAPHHNFQMI